MKTQILLMALVFLLAIPLASAISAVEVKARDWEYLKNNDKNYKDIIQKLREQLDKFNSLKSASNPEIRVDSVKFISKYPLTQEVLEVLSELKIEWEVLT